MTQQIRLEPDIANPRVQIRCGGDLLVEGWEQPLIEVDGQGDHPFVEAGPEQIEIEADSSCRVRLPQTTEIVKIATEGQVKVSNVTGALELTQAKSDLHVDGAGSVKIGNAMGRVTLSKIAGDVQVQKRAHGDVEALEIGGKIAIAEVAGRPDAAGRVHRAGEAGAG